MLNLTENQQIKLDKQFAAFVPGEFVAGSEDLLLYINDKLFGALDPDVNPSVNTITLEELVNLDRNKVAVQNAIDDSKVLRLLTGEDNLMQVGLVNPIKIGLFDGEPVLEGGGHRTAAIKLIYEHFGLGNRFADIEVPCLVMSGNALRIILDNVARGATKIEKVMIHNSADGISVTDIADLYEAYLDDEVSLADAARIGTVLVARDASLSVSLTEETIGAIGASFVNTVKKEYGKHQFTLQDKFLKDLLDFVVEHLEAAVKYVSRTTSNMARATSPMAAYIFSLYRDEVASGSVAILDKPVKEPKVKTARPKAAPKSVQVEGTPSEEQPQKKARKPRAKKQAAESEVVPEE